MLVYFLTSKAMHERYQPKHIEAEIQKRWKESKVFSVIEDPSREKFYCLSMFPYPSGKLHMGHVRNYTIGDVISRYQRMQGKNVLQPMGWDAFGLPAENAAINNNVPPARWTYENIEYMKGQLQSLGFAIAWDRELTTCDPAYYRWNQWLFLRMLETGIAYKKTQIVNWDPVDQTVLANEQVIDGCGWRTGVPIEKREIPGYYLGITRYAEELLADLAELPGWPERVKTMQANWIGKSFGVRFAFPYDLDGKQELLWVFTTRADTIMGVTFCAVAAEHPLASYAASSNPELAAFVDDCKQESVMEADLANIEKKGMPTGIFVKHPLTDEKIEVWVGNYVLMGYGEGAVMAVPAHDERDFHFARQYNLPVKQVIAVTGKKFSTREWQDWYADKDNGHCVNSGNYDGLDYRQATDAIATDLKQKNLGDKQVQWRLRDWGISRQRYWGCPIPIIHCDHCADVPVPDDLLPVVLPEDCVPDGSGNPLNKREDFIKCDCPKCGKPARRETDTMDTFVDSSWYFARYCCADNDDVMVDERVNYWMPVDQYIGGIEHAILHLLYSRFWNKVMRDLGLIKYDEPFANLLTQGMVLNHIYYRKNKKGRLNYFTPAEVEVRYETNGSIASVTAITDGQPVTYGGIGTMSKSKNNGVDPQALIEKYGADTARFFIIFASPPEQTLEWSDSGVEGAYRFLKRLWTFCYQCMPSIKMQHADNDADLPWHGAPACCGKMRREIHLLLQQANFDLAKQQFNTVASACMKMLNVLEQANLSPVPAQPLNYDTKLLAETLGILLRVLAPITPHICEYMWRQLGYGDDILSATWPQPDPAALITEEIELVVQVNGKLRAKVTVPTDANDEEIKSLALKLENVERFTAGKKIIKIIIVPGRLVNIVVS
jgi:leucyl-tRNA synthetase